MTRRPLRVAHLVATSGRSGVESHLAAILPAFDPAVVAARLFVPGPGPLVEALAARGFRAETGSPTRKLAWREAEVLGRRLRGACDVLHAHGPRVAFWSGAIARAADIPRVVHTLHELPALSLPPGPRRWLVAGLESWAAARADRLLVLSADSERRVRARGPRWSDRVRRVPSSSPLLFDPPLLAARPHAPGPLRVLCVGRFHWVKGHDRLLAACARAVAAGADLELTLAGDGPLEPALRARVRALGLEPRVRWPGGTFDLRATLADADVFASASRTETFGLAVLEAMAAGLPVVACAAGGLAELVEPGVTGVLVAADDDARAAQEMAAALAVLATDAPRRRALGEAGARVARERFAPATAAAALTQVYEELA